MNIGELLNGPAAIRSEYPALIFEQRFYSYGRHCENGRRGQVFIVDRAKDMINIGGEKVYPGDVKEVLFRHPAVGDAVVVAANDPILGEVPRAVVALKPGAEVSADQLIAFLRRVLATFKLPRDIEFVSVVPRSASGKLLRRLLQ